MAKEVIRQDIIEINIDSKGMLSALEKIDNEINKLKKAFGVASDDIEEIKRSISGLGNNKGFEKQKEEAQKAKKAFENTKKATEKANKSFDELGKKKFNNLISSLKKVGDVAGGVAKTVGKVSFSLTRKSFFGASAGVGAMVGSSIKGYADYEQLIGGVDTLFKESSNVVQKYANDAYKTAGLSANEYMETVTSFSASLIQSLGGDTKKAAEMSNKAIVDMSDNANKMGTDMGSIMNAYQGFAKANYTMLDNLKLGYGGTQEEMKRLVNDASKVNKEVKANDLSFSNIITAISTIQDGLDITGTTSKEASTTITGSLASVKSSVNNLMTSLIVGGDSFDQCLNNFIETAKIFGKNIKPALEKSLEGIGKLIVSITPYIEQELPNIVSTLLPPILKATTALIKGLIKSIPNIVRAIIKELPTIKNELIGAIKDIFNINGKELNIDFGFIESIGKFLPIILGGLIGVKGFSGISSIMGTISNVIKGVSENIPNVKALENTLKGIAKTNVSTILKGIGKIALVIGGFTLISAGIMKIAPYLSQLTDTKSLLKLVGTIGVLGVVGGVITGITGLIGNIPIPIVLAGIANIALVIGGFAAVIGAFGLISELPYINEFINKGGEFLSNLFRVIGNIAGSLIGGIGEGVISVLPKIGENLSNFAESIKPLFSVLGGENVSGAGAFLSSLGDFMLKMTGSGVLNFFPAGKGVNFAQLGTDLNTFGENSKQFFIGIAEIPTVAFENAKLMFDALKGISKLPNEGGLFQLFSGKNDIKGMAENLPSFGIAMTDFYNSILAIKDYSIIENLFKSLKSARGIESITNLVIENINTIVEKVSELPGKMGEALKSSGKSLASALVEVWKNAVIDSAIPVNKLLDGANWILKEFGSEKRMLKWTPYAKGTKGHKGGNALVNDGRGAEIVQMPNGNSFIPQGRNVFIPNAPKGMKVLNAENTAKLMGRKSPTFKYSDGNINIGEYIGNESGLIESIKKNYVSYKGIKGLGLNIGKGMVNTISSEMINWLKKLYNEFSLLSLNNYNASAGVEQWADIVASALKMEGQYSAENLKRTLYQMQTESGGNPKAINLWDSNAKKGIPSKGLMQVIDPTFKTYAKKGYDTDIYDPLSNVLASIRYAIARYGSLKNAYKGVGYANGGIATKPSIFGEAGAEMAIPLTKNKRGRALELYKQTGDILGVDYTNYTPENSNTIERNVSNENIYNFNININVDGGENNRQTARAIKQAVKDGIKEMMESFANSNKPIREY